MSEKQESMGSRQAFPEKLAKQVKQQFREFAAADLSAFTHEKSKSNFKDAKSDVNVFNGSGKLVLHGREFGNGTFFWQP